MVHSGQTQDGGVNVQIHRLCWNPYRPVARDCYLCGQPALHMLQRDDAIAYLCCSCAEQTSGERCRGHNVAGDEGRIMIRTVPEEELEKVFCRINCPQFGNCRPFCPDKHGLNACGCCNLCDHASCAGRCRRTL